jgi:SAM-dependent methyltransferase
VREIGKSSARLVVGDAGDPAALAGESFDLIFSESVLEHLSSPGDIFANLRTLLKPGGLMVHTYQPFYAELGGHVRGLMDCPFGHVRIPLDEHLRYITEQRPFEAEVAVPWVRDALNRWTQRQFQHSLVANGFEITTWLAERPRLPGLSHAVVADAQRAYPQIDLADLATSGVVVAAR